MLSVLLTCGSIPAEHKLSEGSEAVFVVLCFAACPVHCYMDAAWVLAGVQQYLWRE